MLATALFVGGAVAEATTTNTTEVTWSTLDPTSCRFFNDTMSRYIASHPTNDPRLAQLRAALPNATDNKCRVKHTVSHQNLHTSPVARLLGVVTASADGCSGFWDSLDYYWAGQVWVGYTQVNHGSCWTTDQLVWLTWGPDCNASFYYPYAFQLQWCGTPLNYANPMQVGGNWFVYAILDPFYGHNAWERVNTYNNGLEYVYGG
ncbi:MAG TPA: hypothetical protein VK131_02445 [Candidatus Acidoferrales bacterium]|nr:hypothetical protein [Candidatus Acidoferrales bacterium]